MKRCAAISYQRSVISGTALGSKLKAENRRPKASAAFSLVEVTLALAVMAIGLIAILGLIPQGVQSSRDAADNTLAATIAHDTFSLLRTNAFRNAILCDTCTTPQDLSTYNTTTGSPLVSNAYDQAGFSTNDWGGAYYKVVLAFQPQTPLMLTRVTATITWPAQSKNPLKTDVFVTEIAQFDK